jgi:hypothetical protein
LVKKYKLKKKKNKLTPDHYETNQH